MNLRASEQTNEKIDKLGKKLTKEKKTIEHTNRRTKKSNK